MEWSSGFFPELYKALYVKNIGEVSDGRVRGIIDRNMRQQDPFLLDQVRGGRLNQTQAEMTFIRWVTAIMCFHPHLWPGHVFEFCMQ